MQNPHFRHRSIYGSSADVYASLFKSRAYTVNAVIVIVGMFVQNGLDFDRKECSCCWLALVFQPAVVARFADLQHTAHGFDMVFTLVVEDKQMPLTGLYFFRSFAKKPSASFRMLFAS